MQSNEDDTTSQGSAGGDAAASAGAVTAAAAETEGDEMAVVVAAETEEQEQVVSAETEEHIQRILLAIDNYTRQVRAPGTLLQRRRDRHERRGERGRAAHACVRACACRCRTCWMPGARCSRTSPPTSRTASARKS